MIETKVLDKVKVYLLTNNDTHELSTLLLLNCYIHTLEHLIHMPQTNLLSYKI